MNICVFGDSITWGAYDPKKGGWCTLLRNYLEERYKGEFIDVYNLGISGDTSTGVLERIDSEAKRRAPDTIIIAIGINDSQFFPKENRSTTPINKFEENIANIYAEAKKLADKIIFIGLTNVDDNKMSPTPWNEEKIYKNEIIKKYDSVLEDFCATNNLEFIPMQGVVRDQDLPDGLHPNTEGHKKMFEKILPVIEKLLKA